MSLFEEVQEARTAHQVSMLKRPNVVGLGVGYKVSSSQLTSELCMVVLVRSKMPPVSLREAEFIPREVAGVRTDVVEVGELRPLSVYTDRCRPAPGGVSLGHYKITAGTLGCVVRDLKTGVRMILSNNHVLADRNAGKPGDPILQPGPTDGGTTQRDTIALLERFEPILYNQQPAVCTIARFYAGLGNRLARLVGSHHQVQVFQSFPYATNQIDAALARPILDSDVLDEILEIGAIQGQAEAALGMKVCKAGRTTSLTEGLVNVMDATVTVNYGDERTATFEHQIVSTPMSEGGDSGSLLVASESKKAVGLLFAGSSKATLYNPIQAVFKTLKIGLPIPTAKSAMDQRSVVEKAQAVKDAYTAFLMAKPNVVGVGLGLHKVAGQRTGQVGLVVLVSRKTPDELLSPQDRIPEQIDGVPVDVREVDEFNAL
jgi:hypothetical protein